jgi:hypothetical protein
MQGRRGVERNDGLDGHAFRTSPEEVPVLARSWLTPIGALGEGSSAAILTAVGVNPSTQWRPRSRLL